MTVKAMAKGNPICDVCGESTPRIAAKLLLVPLGDNGNVPKGRRGWRLTSYSAHADVGECCAPKIVKDIKWQKRKPMPAKKKKTAND